MPILYRVSLAWLWIKAHWRPICEGVVAISAVIGILLVWKQLILTRESNIETQRSNEENARQFRVMQRPWVGVIAIGDGEMPTAGRHMLAVAETTNSGHGPALDLMTCVAMATGGKPPDWIHPHLREIGVLKKHATCPLTAGEPNAASILMPNASTVLMITSEYPLTEAQIAELKVGLPIFVYGWITYRDEHEINHATTFCARRDASSGRYFPCPEGGNHAY